MNRTQKRKIETIERRTQILLEVRFEEILMTILSSYFSEYDYNVTSSIIDRICDEVDYKEFCKNYCGRECYLDQYILYIYEHINIEELITEWRLDCNKFQNDFITPVLRDIKLDKLLD